MIRVNNVDVPRLQRYIASVSGMSKASHPAKNAAWPFITLSRQAGSGGHTLAEAIVKKMESEPDAHLFGGWQILDQGLCRRLMEDPQLKVSMESLLTEKFKKESEDFLSQLLVGTSPQLEVFHKAAKIIRSFASAGKVIVVGRAGSFLTRDLPFGTHVRLVASRASRVVTMMLQFDLSKDEAERAVSEQDQSRASLVRAYFNNKDIGDPLYYDAVFNSDAVPIPAIASFIVERVREIKKNSKMLPERSADARR